MSSSELSAAVAASGWRLVLGRLRTAVAVPDPSTGAALVSRIVAAAGPGVLPAVDLRPGRVAVALEPDAGAVERVTAAVRALGLACTPDAVQAVEVAIDALDIPAVLPFWRAVLGYVPAGDRDLVDPAGAGPAVWFQQLDAPRTQRNRIHLDVSVPHDDAPARLAAALAAGGRLVSDRDAPSWWVLADPEGNEACVSTWQGRD